MVNFKHSRRFLRQNYSLTDKFDQFWAVNRRLMESVEQEGFKNIPLRCYNDVSRHTFCSSRALSHEISHAQDGTYFQKLIAPLTEKGQKKTLQDLLSEFSTPVRKAGKKIFPSLFLPPCTMHFTTFAFYNPFYPCTSLKSCKIFIAESTK